MNKDKGNRLDEALSNLPNLAFIGLVEQYIDSVNLFNEQFGTRIGCRRVLNRGTQSRANVSEALREFVAMHNREDAVLYTAAENLFAARTRDLRDCYG
ncbi:MAG: hypothetical protein U5K56_02285 [Halioglobus sp.]|nr:hypothetical protein [Halioglobus sp.]